MKKLTKEQVIEIKKLYAKGKTTQVELAKQFKVSQDTIRYHVCENYKKKRIDSKREKYQNTPKELRISSCKKYPEYYRDYFRVRYKNDEVFREKQKERARNYKREKSGVNI